MHRHCRSHAATRTQRRKQHNNNGTMQTRLCTCVPTAHHELHGKPDVDNLLAFYRYRMVNAVARSRLTDPSAGPSNVDTEPLGAPPGLEPPGLEFLDAPAGLEHLGTPPPGLEGSAEQRHAEQQRNFRIMMPRKQVGGEHELEEQAGTALEF
jgi:hypothetical protein